MKQLCIECVKSVSLNEKAAVTIHIMKFSKSVLLVLQNCPFHLRLVLNLSILHYHQVGLLCKLGRSGLFFPPRMLH